MRIICIIISFSSNICKAVFYIINCALFTFLFDFLSLLDMLCTKKGDQLIKPYCYCSILLLVRETPKSNLNIQVHSVLLDMGEKNRL